MIDKIIVRGAREHNLKNIDLEIPRNQMVVFTGLSGSGKSSLAFDTIFAEGQRRYVESLSAYARQFLGGMQKPDVDEIEGLSPAISIDQRAHSANPRSTVATLTEIYDYLRVLYARVGTPYCPICGHKIEKMTVDEMMDKILNNVIPAPDLGRGQAPAGISSSRVKRMDSRLHGNDKIDLPTDKNVRGNDTLNKIAIFSPVVRGRKGEYYQMLYDLYNDGFLEVRVNGKWYSLKDQIVLDKNKKHTIEVLVDKISLNDWGAGDDKLKEFNRRLSEAIETAVDLSDGLCGVIFPHNEEQIFSTLYSCPHDGFSFPEIEPRLFSFNSPYGYCEACTGLGTESVFSEKTCPKCLGKRLNNNALSVKINDKNIYEVSSLTIGEAQEFFLDLEDFLTASQKIIANTILKEIENRLSFMVDVGLHYLSLNRKAGTLSGGEAQRIRLASQVGQKLVGALYVLDEPTIGLHQRDNEQLVRTLTNLRNAGNTIIVVEHDTDTIQASDWVVDIGPAAGEKGGTVVYSGPLTNLLKNKKLEKTENGVRTFGRPDNSLTGRYLRNELKIEIPEKRRKVDIDTPKIKIKGAAENNLKNINVEIPLRRFVCLTGVSGSGKSTLMNDILYRAVSAKLNHSRKPVGKYGELLGTEYIDKIIRIDQSAIGHSPRSNPATYTGTWGYIRDLFAATPEARLKGYNSGRFSFNRPIGRCEHCEGLGFLEIEMHFLPSVQVKCEVCKGQRFNAETLSIHYKGKNISQVLDMTIAEAEDFFRDIPFIYDKLKVLNGVGLDYLTLGQSAKTLSGGEAQRTKLSRELAKRNTTKTLYLLDEPTTGLHYDDVKKLIGVLQELVSKGNTVMVIEHNLDVIKCADWIIDLGPEGGDKGGQVIATGTPEDVARRANSWTGKYLKTVLDS